MTASARRCAAAGDKEMKCPRCDAKLKPSDPGQYGFVTIDICPSCEGTWFDKGELDRLDESVWVNVEEETNFREAENNHKDLECPKCNANLQALSPNDASEIVVDRCPSCEGFWLDNGELQNMRDVADKMHVEIWKNKTHWTRPPGWSHLRYIIYCYKTFK